MINDGKRKKASLSPPPPPSNTQHSSSVPESKTPGTGIDRATAERFRRGSYPIDARLDLHGMNRQEAFRALSAFIASHVVRRSRCLLIITGKGKGEGVLRQALPGWLAVPELGPAILAFAQAKPKHGGSGAYYVLLRRKR